MENTTPNKFLRSLIEKRLNFMTNSNYIRKDKGIPLDVIDKSLNPLIYSASKFKNIYYGRPPTLRALEKVFNINPVYYLLSFPESFIWIKGKNYMFYSPSLKFSYEINKKLKLNIKALTENAYENTFLELTWKILIDKVVEYKSQFYLDQMYIVEYSNISKQEILNVEYIGLSRLQSEIILDDTIRENINKKLADIKENRTVTNWVLEEFIKNRPLSPYIQRYLHGRLSPPEHWKNEKTGELKSYVYTRENTLIYTLSLEGTLKMFKEIKGANSPFGGDFFSLRHETVKYVKENANKMRGASADISSIFQEFETGPLANHLLATIERNNRSYFINTLMKNFLNISHSQKEDIRWRLTRLNNYIFKYIISNDVSWKEFSLPIVIGLIYGGKKNEK